MYCFFCHPISRSRKTHHQILHPSTRPADKNQIVSLAQRDFVFSTLWLSKNGGQKKMSLELRNKAVKGILISVTEHSTLVGKCSGLDARLPRIENLFLTFLPYLITYAE